MHSQVNTILYNKRIRYEYQSKYKTITRHSFAKILKR